MHRMRIATIVMTSLLLAAPGRDRPDTLVHAADPAIEQPQAAATTGGPADAPLAAAAPLATATPAAADTARAERVLDFVVRHQPDLAELLARLEKRKPTEYAAAIADLDRSVLALTASKAKDEQLYEIELRAWQARTRIDLLVARWMTGTKKNRALLEPDIRAAVAAEIDARADALAYRKQRSAAWYDRQIMKLRDRRDELVTDRLESLLAEPGRKPKPAVSAGR